jgi:predicted transcriptional regulator
MTLATSEQLRAARAMLRLEQGQLAAAAGVHPNTLAKIEASPGLISARTETVRRLQRALEEAGVELLPGAGVRLREQPAKAQAS